MRRVDVCIVLLKDHVMRDTVKERNQILEQRIAICFGFTLLETVAENPRPVGVIAANAMIPFLLIAIFFPWRSAFKRIIVP